MNENRGEGGGNHISKAIYMLPRVLPCPASCVLCLVCLRLVSGCHRAATVSRSAVGRRGSPNFIVAWRGVSLVSFLER